MGKFISNPTVNVDPAAVVVQAPPTAPVSEEKVVRAVAPVEKVRVAPKPRAACPKKPAAAAVAVAVAPMAQVPEESVVPPTPTPTPTPTPAPVKTAVKKV